MKLKETLNEVIRKKRNYWYLYTKDGNKVLGKHKTKKKAIKQEIAINISKGNK